MSFPIYEPVTECIIIYRYWATAPDQRSIVEYNDQFTSIAALKNYFQRIPGAGPLVGYGAKKSWHTWAHSAKLLLKWTDRSGTSSTEFEDASKFIEFIKERPALAKALEYSV